MNTPDPVRELEPEETISSQHARNAELEELLRSACAIAERKGERTHWGRFIASVNKLGLNGVTARTYRVLESDDESPPNEKGQP